MNIQNATISDLLAAGISVTLDPVALKFKREGGLDVNPSTESPVETFQEALDKFKASTPSESPKVSRTPKASTVVVKSPRGAILRTYHNVSQMVKDDRKVIEAMVVCASEGWHLWEMQYAIYCARKGVTPDLADRPALPNLGCNWLNDPVGYNFEFVRDAFVKYSKNMNRTLIRKLNAI